MADLQLVHYIEKEFEKGFTREQVKEVLVKYGHPSEKIDECFAYLDAKAKDEHMQMAGSQAFKKAEQELVKPMEPAKPESRFPIDLKPKNIYIIIGVIVLIIIGSFLIMKFAFSGDNPTEKEPEQDEPDRPNPIQYEPTKQTEPDVEGIMSPSILQTDPAERKKAFDRMVDDCVEGEIERIDKICPALVLDDITKCDDNITCIDDYHLYSAIVVNNQDACEKISDKTLKKGCQVLLNDNAEDCKSFEGDMRFYCEAVINRKLEKCYEIQTSEVQDQCWGDIRLFNAFSTKDPKYCAAIKGDDEKKNLCFAFVEDNPDYCYNSVGCEIQAHYNIARITKDASQCEKISDEQIKQQCIDELS